MRARRDVPCVPKFYRRNDSERNARPAFSSRTMYALSNCDVHTEARFSSEDTHTLSRIFERLLSTLMTGIHSDRPDALDFRQSAQQLAGFSERAYSAIGWHCTLGPVLRSINRIINATCGRALASEREKGDAANCTRARIQPVLARGISPSISSILGIYRWKYEHLTRALCTRNSAELSGESARRVRYSGDANVAINPLSAEHFGAKRSLRMKCLESVGNGRSRWGK